MADPSKPHDPRSKRAVLQQGAGALATLFVVGALVMKPRIQSGLEEESRRVLADAGIPATVDFVFQDGRILCAEQLDDPEAARALVLEVRGVRSVTIDTICIDGPPDGNGPGDTVFYPDAGSAIAVDLAAGTATGGGGSDTLTGVENITGTPYADTITGNASANRLVGGDGPDTLAGAGGNDLLIGGNGRDRLLGGADDDTLIGGQGADVLDGGLDGGLGNDHFVFDDGHTGVGVANRDVLINFATGDTIDFSAIDANSTVGGGGSDGQSFTFIGNAAFSDGSPGAVLAAGQVRYQFVDLDGNGVAESTLIQANTDNNLGVDFEVLLENHTTPLTVNDFLL